MKRLPYAEVSMNRAANIRPSVVKVFLVCALSLGSVSCCNVVRHDTLDGQKADFALGSRVITKTELVGIVVDPFTMTNDLQLYITPFPGFGGPEVEARIPIAKGQVFEVTGILRSCATEFAIVRSDTKFYLEPVEILLDLRQTSEGRLEFQPEYFDGYPVTK